MVYYFQLEKIKKLVMEKRNNEALKILLEAKTNGIISAGFIYFDTLLDGNGFKYLIDSSLKLYCNS